MDELHLALPVSGALYEGSMKLFNDCGLGVSRSNDRVYTATIPSIEGLNVIFQRQSDIPSRLDAKVADMGIVGLDSFYEFKVDNGNTITLIEDLGFGKSDLVLAVPDAWLDISNLNDLANLSYEMRDKGKDLRIATKYPRLLSRFLNNNSIFYFQIVDASGGIEAAPFIGYADLICDITATGNTLRQNRLKIIEDGVVFSSQAALIANVDCFIGSEEKIIRSRNIIEQIEALINAKDFKKINVNLSVQQDQNVEEMIKSNPILQGLKGPHYSQVINVEPGLWYNFELTIRQEEVMEAVDELRKLGGVSITTSDVGMLFFRDSVGFSKLIQYLDDIGD